MILVCYLALSDCSLEDSGTSTPLTTATPSRTPSLESVTPPTVATNVGTTLNPAKSDTTNTVLTTEATNTTALLSTAVTNKNGDWTTEETETIGVLTTSVTDTNATLTAAATDINVTSTTAAASLSAALTTVATSVKPAFTLAVDKINAHQENDRETKVNSKAPTTQIPSATSAGMRPKVHEFNSPVPDLDNSYEEDNKEDPEEDEKNKRRGDLPKCSHDPCEHLQWPCLEVSQRSCLCPSLTPESVAPAQPLSVDAQDVTARSAEVRWCAPNSAVSGYELQVREKASGALISHDLNHTFRRFRLTGLRERWGYTACVIAKNLAGSSPSRCVELTTGRGVTAVTYGLGAAVAGLAVLVLVLAVCLRRQCRKLPLESQRNTSLVSIPNPAYCHPQETADIVKV